MSHNALASPDRPERLYPAGHPLHRLARPTFDSIRRALDGCCVSAIWIDSILDPSREGYRPSYDGIYGPGSSNVMPLIATWLSTGPGTEGRGNVVLLPDAIDRTAVAYMRDIGLIGAVEYVTDLASIKAAVVRSGRKVYSIDDLGADFDAHSLVGSRLSRWLNTKEQLGTISRFAPTETVKDMFEVTAADFAAHKREGRRVFVKTCNTESAGAGVHIATTRDEFDALLAELRARQQRFGLNRRVVIQPEIVGRNRSFQVFLDPARRDEIQIVALTDQLVEADGKTYRASINHPITPETTDHIGAVILDMVDRVWARHPEAFGFLMCDYFQTDDGPVIYDPGIRPTGNTATAMAFHLARKITGRDMFVSLMHLRTQIPGLKFQRFRERVGRLCDPGNLRREGRAVFPWGWNDVVGFGAIIGVAGDEAGFEALRAEVLGLDYS